MLVIAFTLRSPTCVAQRPTAPGQPTESLPYLTGTVVRAALASLFLRGRRYETSELTADEREQFRQLFLNGGVRFGNALPQSAEGRGSTQIVPRTAWSAKRKGGWQGDDPDNSGVCDALAALMRDGGEALTDKGFDRLSEDFAWVSRSTWKKIEVRRRLINRTALTRNTEGLLPGTRGVAADGQLYSFEALETGQVFMTPLEGDPALLAIIGTLLYQPATVSVGQGRSRGMGQLTAQLFNVPDPRIRKNADLAEQALAFTQRAGGGSEDVYLPVTLLADTILRDNYLLPCSSGDPGVTLARYSAAAPPQGMYLRYAVQGSRWLGGWDEVRHIPRPAQLAVQQGSVWVYQIERSQLMSAIDWWLEVEKNGVGERIGEGFGRLMLLHPFHSEDEQVLR
jgi:CRISPR-associated protein Csx10